MWEGLVVLLAASASHAVDDGVFVLDVAQSQRDGDEREHEDDGEPEHDVEHDGIVLVRQIGEVVLRLGVLKFNKIMNNQ